MTNWQAPDEVPRDGESVLVVVREWDGKHFHVDYGVVFYDTDGPIVRLFEREIFEHWPAGMVAWMPCEMPEWSQSSAPPMPPIDDSSKTNIVTWGREPAQKEAAAKAGETIAKQRG